MVNNQIDKLIENMESLQNKTTITFSELFSTEFMRQYTSSESINSFIDASGFIVESIDDFEGIPDEPWDLYISENTSFINWVEMQKKAHEAFLKKILKI